MKETTYLAIDIGASSGRHILFSRRKGIIHMEEIYRFSNGAVKKNGHLVWDVDRLFQEIVNGLKACKDAGKIPKSVGIDTWGVDFVLLDAEGNRLTDAVCYRDHRTDGIDREVEQILSRAELYGKTGIQKAIFNTIYQLMALKKESPEVLKKAETFLMMPDYLNYLLTDVKSLEYTEASTTSLLNARTCEFDADILSKLGIPERIFPKIRMAGESLGAFTDQVAKEVGFTAEVVLPATHDTGSAVLAVPAKEKAVYLSSGTWSLMGVENEKPETGENAFRLNFTNEGGYRYRYRFLKNIMGLWMIQSVKNEAEAKGEKISFGDLSERASKETIPSIIPCNDDRVLSPASMTEEVRNCCREQNDPVPETLSEIAAVIYNSLAVCYKDTVAEIESVTGEHYDTIYIVGGGSDAVFLNEQTKRATARKIVAGPKEATAIGNALVQMLADGTFSSLEEGREAIRRSFPIREY